MKQAVKSVKAATKPTAEKKPWTPPTVAEVVADYCSKEGAKRKDAIGTLMALIVPNVMNMLANHEDITRKELEDAVCRATNDTLRQVRAARMKKPMVQMKVNLIPDSYGKLCEGGIVLGCSPEAVLDLYINSIPELSEWANKGFRL